MNQHKATFTIKTFEIGPMANLIYLITDIQTRKCAIVDPAWDLRGVYEYINQNNLVLNRILLTHSHNDHINAIDEVLGSYDIPINLNNEEKNFWGTNYDNFDINYGGDQIILGKTLIKALHTPGHTPGSTCYLIDDQLIAGDTLFVFGCGRCDLHGGNPEEMYQSLNQLRQCLGDSTIILPGHNYSIKKASMFKDELESNPFFHFQNLEDFVQYRMSIHDKVRSSPYGPVKSNTKVY